MALKLVKPGPAVFQVQDGQLTAVTPVTWTVWAAGRIYPPEGTYWVEATPGLNVEKRGSETVNITPPTLVAFRDGDYLLIQQREDGRAIRVTPA